MIGTGFWWVLLSCALYGVIHSALASNRAKSWAEHKFGASFKQVYRLLYVVFAFVLVVPLLIAVAATPDAVIYRIPKPWLFLTLTLQAAALVCLGLSFIQSKPLVFMGLPAVLGKEEKIAEKLTTSGFYALVRHPIYFLSFILMWCFPIMTWNLLALFGGLTVYTIIGSLFEERRLLAQFGEEYREYQKKTPWLIPIRRKRG